MHESDKGPDQESFSNQALLGSGELLKKVKEIYASVVRGLIKTPARRSAPKSSWRTRLEGGDIFQERG